MCGMLTYQDFSFLLNLLATPRRYLDIGFHCFDVSADGNIEAKVKILFTSYIFLNINERALIRVDAT